MNRHVPSFLLWVCYGLAAVAFLYGGMLTGPVVRQAYQSLFPSPEFIVGDYSELLAQAKHPVVIFTTSTCPFCGSTRKLLDARHVAYMDYVIDKSPVAKEYYARLDLTAVPVLFIGNRRIIGFREQTILDSLGAEISSIQQ